LTEERGAPAHPNRMTELSSAYPGGSLSQQPESDDEDEIETPRFEPVPLPDDEFKDQLAQVIPHLRAFGRSLSGSRDLADEVKQRGIVEQISGRHAARLLKRGRSNRTASASG